MKGSGESLLYNEIEYWRRRKHPNNPDGNPESDVSYLRKHLGDVGFVLDYGPGVGRTFEVYDWHTVVGYDITDLYYDRAMAKAMSVGFTYVPVVVKKIDRMPFPDNTFEAAVACEVLHHIRPENIRMVISDLRRVADKVIVITAYTENKPFDVQTTLSHCYNHPYFDLCPNIDSIEQTNNQLFFVYG